jgi:hypothetical protein
MRACRREQSVPSAVSPSRSSSTANASASTEATAARPSGNDDAVASGAVTYSSP